MKILRRVWPEYETLVIKDLPPKSWNISQRCENAIENMPIRNSVTELVKRPWTAKIKSIARTTHQIIWCKRGIGVILLSFFIKTSFRQMSRIQTTLV